MSVGGVVFSGGGVVFGGGGPGLFRSRSLPHLSGNDSAAGGSYSDGGCPDDGGRGGGGGHALGTAPPPGHRCSKSQPAGLSGLGDVRQLVTLKQHYYPEGGWGWVVAAVAVAAHLLSHGLHLASGVFVQELVRKFGTDAVVPAGTVHAERATRAIAIRSCGDCARHTFRGPLRAEECVGIFRFRLFSSDGVACIGVLG